MKEELQDELIDALKEFNVSMRLSRYIFLAFCCLIFVWLFVGFFVMLFNS